MGAASGRDDVTTLAHNKTPARRPAFKFCPRRNVCGASGDLARPVLVGGPTLEETSSEPVHSDVNQRVLVEVT